MTFHGMAPLAALTTIFTPPCPTSWLVTTSKVPSQFPSFPGTGPVPTCNPPSWQDNLSAEGFSFYSPAICPSGFEVGPGCLLTTTPRTTEGFPPTSPGETVAWCVPRGQSCTSDTTDFRGGYWGVTQTATVTGALATVGPAMQIRFRDIDLSILETHPLTPGLTLAGLPTPASASDTATTPSPTSQEPPQTSVASPNTSTAPSSPRVQTARGPSTSATGTDGFMSNGTAAASSLPRPTSTPSRPAGLGPSAGGSKDHTPSSHTRVFAATVAMSCLSGVSVIAIGSCFLFSRRRQHSREKNKQATRDGDAELGGDTGAAAGSSAGGAASDGSVVALMSKAKIWWASFPFFQSRSALTGDSNNMLSAWKRRQRTSKWKGHLAHQQREEEQEQQARGANAVPAGAVLSSLPTLELDLGDEKFGHSIDDNAADAASDIEDVGSVVDTNANLPQTKGIPSKPRADRTSARQSWMSRLSRYMRGDPGRNTAMSGSSTPNADRASSKAGPISNDPGSRADHSTERVINGNDNNSNDSSDGNEDDETSNGHASTRWSRGTRADTLSIVTDGADYHGHQRGLSDPNCVRADSWAAFSRSHQGLARILAAKKIKGNARSLTSPGSPDSPGSPRSPQQGSSAASVRIRMQSMAFGNGDASKDLLSPTMTVRSGRTSVQRDSRWLSVDSKHLSGFSDGTFGRMDSFVSKASSPTWEMPPVQEEHGRDASGTNKEVEDKEKEVQSLEAW